MNPLHVAQDDLALTLCGQRIGHRNPVRFTQEAHLSMALAGSSVQMGDGATYPTLCHECVALHAQEVAR